MGLSLPPPSSSDEAITMAADRPEGAGRLATVISLLAFLFSGLSYYESALKQADLDVFVPPVIQYGRDSGGDIELFAVPITIANGGSNTGTVLAMDLTVESLAANADPHKKIYYSAFVGEHSRKDDAPNKSFAPIAIPGRATYTETIRFYPQGNPLPKLVQDAGEFKFTLALTVATPSEPSWLERILKVRTPPPLVFTRTLPWISEQQLGLRRVTIAMHARDWKPTLSGAQQ